jgi:hypothetical protein
MEIRPNTSDLRAYRLPNGPDAGKQAKELYTRYAFDRLSSMSKQDAKDWISSDGHVREIAALMRNRRGAYSTPESASKEVRVNMGLIGVNTLRDVITTVEQALRNS